MFCRLRAALRHIVYPGMRSRIVAIRLGPGDTIASALRELQTLCAALDVEFSAISASTPQNGAERLTDLEELGRTLRQPAGFVLIPDGVTPPPEFEAHFDDAVVLSAPTPAHYSALVHSATGRHPDGEVLRRVRLLHGVDLDLALRERRSLRDLIAHLDRLDAALVSRPNSDASASDNQCKATPEVALRGDVATPPNLQKTITLDDVAGMDEAVAWGRSLACDFEAWRAGEIAWSHIDPGVLLAGPPGTGKTLFAQALANSVDAHFEAASLAVWQAAGYLNDLLKAMRRAFSKAQNHAPAILFIDEIDAVGDRATLQGHNASYNREVINALLECLDGAARREGVVVIAATNAPEKLDPALLRAGRLDRVIWVSHPDRAARAKILRVHLESDAVRQEFDDAALDDIVAPLQDYTGADIERLVRLARRRARSERRILRIGDLIAERPVPPLLTAADLRRVAVHEAGHAITAHLQGFKVASMELMAGFLPNGAWSGGHTRTIPPVTIIETETLLRSELAVLLGGHAAEHVTFGDRSAGAGGTAQGGDLHEATKLAIRLEAQLGLGDGIAQLTTAPVIDVAEHMKDRALRDRVDVLLKRIYSDVCLSITEHRGGLDRLAAALEASGKLSAGEIVRLLTS
jgi:ATP-dependent Zn protease